MTQSYMKQLFLIINVFCICSCNHKLYKPTYFENLPNSYYSNTTPTNIYKSINISRELMYRGYTKETTLEYYDDLAFLLQHEYYVATKRLNNSNKDNIYTSPILLLNGTHLKMIYTCDLSPNDWLYIFLLDKLRSKHFKYRLNE